MRVVVSGVGWLGGGVKGTGAGCGGTAAGGEEIAMVIGSGGRRVWATGKVGWECAGGKLKGGVVGGHFGCGGMAGCGKCGSVGGKCCGTG